MPPKKRQLGGAKRYFVAPGVIALEPDDDDEPETVKLIEPKEEPKASRGSRPPPPAVKPEPEVQEPPEEKDDDDEVLADLLQLPAVSQKRPPSPLPSAVAGKELKRLRRVKETPGESEEALPKEQASIKEEDKEDVRKETASPAEVGTAPRPRRQRKPPAKVGAPQAPRDLKAEEVAPPAASTPPQAPPPPPTRSWQRPVVQPVTPPLAELRPRRASPAGGPGKMPQTPPHSSQGPRMPTTPVQNLAPPQEPRFRDPGHLAPETPVSGPARLAPKTSKKGVRKPDIFDRALNVLFVGDLCGRLDLLHGLLKSLGAQASGQPPIDLVLAVGRFLPIDSDSSSKEIFNEYIGRQPNKELPCEVFFIESDHEDLLAQGAENGKPTFLAKGITFLGACGVDTVCGINVAFLSGRYDEVAFPQVWGTGSFVEKDGKGAGANYTGNAITEVMKQAKIQQKPVDFLLTSEWPDTTWDTFQDKEVPQTNVDKSFTSPAVRQLVYGLKPRYHIFARAGRSTYSKRPHGMQGFLCTSIGLAKASPDVDVKAALMNRNQENRWFHAAIISRESLVQRPRYFPKAPTRTRSPQSVRPEDQSYQLRPRTDPGTAAAARGASRAASGRANEGYSVASVPFELNVKQSDFEIVEGEKEEEEEDADNMEADEEAEMRFYRESLQETEV